MTEDSLRIDKFLWFARLVRHRALAKKLAEKGHVRIDGRRVKSAHALVRKGAILSIPLPREVCVIRIAELPVRRVSAKEVPAIYERLNGLDNSNR
jgi:ribosome-associated heat shock protein Hsp15